MNPNPADGDENLSQVWNAPVTFSVPMAVYGLVGGSLRRSVSALGTRVRREFARGISHSAIVQSPVRLAVIGSGPAGFYTASRVLKDVEDVQVDMYEALPVPHGLVRFGVAPDHPEVKHKFDEVATDPRFGFIGNATIGKDFTLEDLKSHYDGIVLAYGASEDRRLGIENEDTPGVFSARAFVGWYNGLPIHRDLEPDLTRTDTAVIIGQGNVALDIGRILLSPVDMLRKTDITEYALEALSKSRIKRVHIVGRRGPLQVAFTAKELREMMTLPDVGFDTDYELLSSQLAAGSDLMSRNRALKRLMGILEKGSKTPFDTASKSWSLQFLRSPTKIHSGPDGRVSGITYELNQLQGPPEKAKAVGTGQFEDQACGLVFRSIGYKSIALEGLPFNQQSGTVPNEYGKVGDGDHVKGTYHCSNCSNKGSWQDYVKKLKQKQKQRHQMHIQDSSDLVKKNSGSFAKSLEEINAMPQQLFHHPHLVDWCVRDMKIDADVLKRYKVGVGSYPTHSSRIAAIQDKREPHEVPCLTFPQTALDYFSSIDQQGQQDTGVGHRIVRLKAYSPDLHETVTYDPPNQATAGLFGYHTAPFDADTVILTRKELDAMSAYQMTGIPSISLPTPNYTFPEKLTPLLDRFSKIYVWMDDDVEGQTAADRIARKLGESRCLIVHTRSGDLEGPLNAHHVLMQGKSIPELLASAQPVRHDKIVEFADLRDEVYREIMNPEQARGVQSKDLPGLNQVLKGHRPGELTILTGPTGIGKTTIISQLSLDYCKSGVSTLWGSFEIWNTRLARRMLSQYAGTDFSKSREEFDVWADEFQQLPLYFLKFFGSTGVRDVLQACNHAVWAYDVRHIVLDNLQFMLSQQGRSSLERWELQDDAIAEIRRFATQKDVHITLVVHPRKESGQGLDINSVFGSAKVTQEADNVIIIQDADGDRFIDVRKNRFDGTLGQIPFKFDRTTFKILPLDDEEMAALRKKYSQQAKQYAHRAYEKPYTPRNIS
ncbi:hypothetical protein BZG36_04272 [Bifiguratus adelaidae]|uniref:NADPH:adrenodoxin oxidoreductase, mitochondrial n=1 Tax=Bifiguratus adelaidae TaxID=1938954 RepID=A0A261XWT5_9FUNG|nr:hypothetical protein BZG36_04272 [Bifiguratus adelaidae]